MACAIAIVGGAVVPAMHGWIVGISDILVVLDEVAAGASQALALYLLFAMGGLVVQLMKSRAPIVLRGAGLLLGSLIGMAVFATILFERMPLLLHVLVGATAAALALGFGADALRQRAFAALVPMTVAVASLVRGSGAYLAERALVTRRDVETIRSSLETAELLATCSVVIVAIACGVTAYWMIRVERRRGIGAVALSVVIAAVVAWKGAAAPGDVDAAWSVLVRRTAQELTTLPKPMLPDFVTLLFTVLPFAMACFAVATRRQPIAGAAIALSLIAGSSAEVPLLGLGLAVGAIALSLDRRDGSGVFAALESAPVESREPPIAAPAAPADDAIVAARPLD